MAIAYIDYGQQEFGIAAALSGDMALRLEKLLGSSAESWLNMQQAVDLWEARQDVQRFAHVVRYANSQTSLAT